MATYPQHKISLPVIKRLPRYLRHVQLLQKACVETVSSSELAAMLGNTASQVRQDFNCFGGFGQQGVGYNVVLLCKALEQLLVGGSHLPAILIGTGRLGCTISGFLGSTGAGFHLTAAFDNAPAQIGTALGGLVVQDVATLAEYCGASPPEVAVLCIPEDSASGMAQVLLSLGIKGFWNFSQYDLAAASPGVVVENVHLGDSLQSLGYRVRNI